VHRRTTEAAFDSHLRNHILPLLGHRPMGAVTRSEIQGWVKSRSAVLAPSTTTLVYSVLRMIFRSAVADRVLAVSPCERITLPKAPPTQVHPLPVEAVAALAEAVPARYRALLVCAAGTGLRQGEVLGLRRDRVDFLRRVLTVDGQLVLMPGGPPYLAPPKTTASYRTVPLADVVLQALSAHVAAFPAALTDDARRRPSSCCSPTTAATRWVAPGSTDVSGRRPYEPSACRPARTSTSSGTSTPRCSSMVGRA
jgi:integrase